MKLFTFAISHYAEKARWALDHKHVGYQEVILVPGPHVRTITRIAPKSEVPVLQDGCTVVQGSAAIIEYVDRQSEPHPLTPRDPAEAEQCRQLEHIIDEEIGPRIRRVFYHHALQRASFAKRFFLHRAPWWGRPLYVAFFPFLKIEILRRYEVTRSAAARDLADLDRLFGDMERLFGDDGYLVGGGFTRADLALCAMAAHVFRPAQHCFPWPAVTEYPPGLLDAYQRFEGRPIQHYVLEHYRTSRLPEGVNTEAVDTDGDALPAIPAARG